jgi:hypothetical protein
LSLLGAARDAHAPVGRRRDLASYLIGYGTGANASKAARLQHSPNTTAGLRLLGGCAESDNNQMDFNVAGSAYAPYSGSLSQSCVQTGDCSAADTPILILGDMNAYAREDPIQALESAGYTGPDPVPTSERLRTRTCSMVNWAYLDHALSSPSLVSQVAGVVEWHSNADEPTALDYNTDFKSAAQVTSLYGEDPFRASDHDPVLVGLDLGASSAAAVPGTGALPRWAWRCCSAGSASWLLKRSESLPRAERLSEGGARMVLRDPGPACLFA